MPRSLTALTMAPQHIGKIVATIGREAGVVVHTDPRTGKVKHASAHDLRRSFGERWAGRVMPQDLKELMRHESIDTTLKYYVGRNAQTIAARLWAARSEFGQGTILGTIGENNPTPAGKEEDANPREERDLRQGWVKGLEPSTSGTTICECKHTKSTGKSKHIYSYTIAAHFATPCSPQQRIVVSLGKQGYPIGVKG